MDESFFQELKRFVRFTPEDETALRALHDDAEPHFDRIVDLFYDRLLSHPEAMRVFSGPEQVERLKGALRAWMDLLLRGPWDEAYFHQRARIGRVHVKIDLPQRYMFTAMNLIRLELIQVAQLASARDPPRLGPTSSAIAKIIDLELAIMLETYREAYVDKIRELERKEKASLAERLALSEARYAQIVEEGEALVVTTDPAGVVTFYNRRCEELTGIPRAQAIGRRFSHIFGGGIDSDALWAKKQAALAGEHVQPFVAATHAAGATKWVRWHLTQFPGAGAPMICALGVDMTEERALTARTQQAERLAALGTMAAGLAHEIRNPLNAAHLQLTLVKRRLMRPEPDVHGALAAVELAASEGGRLAELVDEFLRFARPQPLRWGRGNLRATAETIVSLLGPQASAAGVELSLDPGGDVPFDYDDERMKQVIHNLVHNAIEAAGRGGKVRVGIGGRDAAALLEVEDDGPGLPYPDAPIFEPFFTTKERGIGLGLAIVHRIVTDHGGRIDVERRGGRTVFSVVLPSND